MRIILLGAPGSGKRTQTKLLVEKYGIPPISTGELIKSAIADGSALGQRVTAAMDAGEMVSESLVLELIHERLLLPDAQHGFILDGFPRNILQALTLDELLFELEQPIELVLLINIETDALMERLVGRRTCRSCGTLYNIYINPTAVDDVCDLCGGKLRHRADDNEETVSGRLHVYDHLVAPLMKYYGKQQKLVLVDGYGQIDEVFEWICQVVDDYQPPVVSQPLTQPELKAAKAGKSASGQDTEVVEAGAPQPVPASKQPAVKKAAGKKQANKKKAAKRPVLNKPVGSKSAQAKKKITAVKKIKKKPAGKVSAEAKQRQPDGKRKVAKKSLAKIAGPAKKPTGKKQPVGKKARSAANKTAAKKKSVAKKPSAAKQRSAKKKSAK